MEVTAQSCPDGRHDCHNRSGDTDVVESFTAHRLLHHGAPVEAQAAVGAMSTTDVGAAIFSVTRTSRVSILKLHMSRPLPLNALIAPPVEQNTMECHSTWIFCSILVMVAVDKPHACVMSMTQATTTSV